MTEHKQSGWWWLSFGDGERPEGEQFLGGAVVFGPSFELAVLRSHFLGINPGGEVEGMGIVEGRTPDERWRERLLSKAEALELKAWGDRRWLVKPPKPAAAEPEFGTFKVLVNGVQVAGGAGPYEDCKREAAHYAAQYADEGEVQVRVRRNPARRPKA